MSQETILEIKGLQAHYGHIHALKGIDLTIGAGEIVTLIGGNGAGKSTTLRAISGLLKPSHGSIRFMGQEIIGLIPAKIAALGIVHVPEGRRVFSRLTVLENLEMGGYLRTRAEVKAGILDAFERFPILKERQKQSAGTLSGGEQQMLAIARAMMAHPKMLLLDEPSMGLAPLIVKQIMRIVREINASGIPVFLVEQNAKQALGIASRGYVLETGEVKLSDRADVLLASTAVREAYLGT